MRQFLAELDLHFSFYLLAACYTALLLLAVASIQTLGFILRAIGAPVLARLRPPPATLPVASAHGPGREPDVAAFQTFLCVFAAFGHAAMLHDARFLRVATRAETSAAVAIRQRNQDADNHYEDCNLKAERKDLFTYFLCFFSYNSKTCGYPITHNLKTSAFI